MTALKKHNDAPEGLESLSSRVVDAIFQVHKNIGPGYLEKIYEECLCMELQEKGIAFTRQFPVSLQYKGKPVPADFRLDIVVDGKILIELKSVEKMNPVYDAQVLSYLKMSELPMGFLVNFNVPLIKEGIKRFVSANLRTFVSSC